MNEHELLHQFHLLHERLSIIMASLQDISNAVAAETTVEQSVILLLQTLSADLATALANNDQATMATIVTNIQANTTALAAAVTANTPASPAPTPAPAS